MRNDPAGPGPDAWLGRAVETLREPVVLDPGYLERALANLGSEDPVVPRRLPAIAWSLAAAAALVVAIGLGRSGGTAARDDREPVRFSVTAPAGQVALVGDFNDWNPGANPLEQRGEAWSLTLELPPGRYRYAYLVDGRRWLPDPGLPAADDDFDTPTSVITVAH